MNKRCAMWLPTFLQRGIHFCGERTEVLAFNNFVLFESCPSAYHRKARGRGRGGFTVCDHSSHNFLAVTHERKSNYMILLSRARISTPVTGETVTPDGCEARGTKRLEPPPLVSSERKSFRMRCVDLRFESPRARGL
jgi:hypothetical protein